ncbi:LacI family DNA-binding transcriptional regulator [Lentzea sp.]|uniref:LacI family DNA-binding transcriptional regulator n=1 Tax=Lentzea sp. TaxID=56099 RepID=UPI002ED165A0
MGRRVTINDVARAAGVSRQTVSRALNDKGEIDGGTKQRVLDAAKELGYRPSRFARGLVRQDSTTIGLVIPDLLNPFFTEVAAGALEAARARGWHVIVYDTADSTAEESTLAVAVSQVDAVVGYFSLGESELDGHLTGIPAVLIGREHHTPRFSSIRVDGRAGIREAVGHLVARGHTSIGMLDHAGRAGPSPRHDWFAGAMTEHGLPAHLVGNAVQSVDGGAEALHELLGRHPGLTAVLTYNDVIAVGALKAARRLGRIVPDDLAVVGFDGLQLGTVVDPALTSVALDTTRIGALAIEQAGRLLHGDPLLPDEELQVDGVLVVRESA